MAAVLIPHHAWISHSPQCGELVLKTTPIHRQQCLEHLTDLNLAELAVTVNIHGAEPASWVSLEVWNL